MLLNLTLKISVNSSNLNKKMMIKAHFLFLDLSSVFATYYILM